MSFLILLTIVSITATTSMACFCAPREPGQVFCASTFVGVVRVISGPTPCDYSAHCFQVLTSEVLKPGSLNVSTIRTSPSSASCGLTFISNHMYLVAGNPDSSGILGAYSCGLVRDWTDTSNQTRSETTDLFKVAECPASST